MVDDRIQAKWEDGKMYFGKVLQVYEGIVQICSIVPRLYVCQFVYYAFILRYSRCFV